MTTAGKYHLYLDDTGSRDPDKAYAPESHEDRMDCFGLGGILIKEADIDATIKGIRSSAPSRISPIRSTRTASDVDAENSLG